MGSKNLKAVAARGTSKISVADPVKVKEANAAMRAGMKVSPFTPGLKPVEQVSSPPIQHSMVIHPSRTGAAWAWDSFAADQVAELNGITNQYQISRQAVCLCYMPSGLRF